MAPKCSHCGRFMRWLKDEPTTGFPFRNMASSQPYGVFVCAKPAWGREHRELHPVAWPAL